VILEKNDEQSWLQSILDKERATSLLVPYDEKNMEAYTISRLITSRTQSPNTPKVLDPYTYPELQPRVRQKKLE
jgi:putative SOS response-associated peptidase YedK